MNEDKINEIAKEIAKRISEKFRNEKKLLISDITMDKEFVENWEQDEFYSDGGGYFECPECGETLFTDEGEAKKFLCQKGGGEK
jgi:hypothetical protein